VFKNSDSHSLAELKGLGGSGRWPHPYAPRAGQTPLAGEGGSAVCQPPPTPTPLALLQCRLPLGLAAVRRWAWPYVSPARPAAAYSRI
jgi:hypothetical protein